MRILLMKTMAIFLALSAVALGQDNFYYEYSTPIQLSASPDYVMIRPDDLEYDVFSELFALVEGIDSGIEPIRVQDGFVILGVRDGYSSTAVASQLRTTNGIMFANNVYLDADSAYFYPRIIFTCILGRPQRIIKSIRSLMPKTLRLLVHSTVIPSFALPGSPLLLRLT
jgi:hypothetical protein